MEKQRSSINKFPSKSKKEFNKYVKMFAVATVVSGGSMGILSKMGDNEVKAEETGLKTFDYIEKEATALDPSLHSTVSDLLQSEYLMGSSFLDEYEEKEGKYSTIVDDNGNSFLELTNNDYLQYVSANGDNVTVRYVDNSGKILLFDDLESESDNGHSHSGWLIYPFLYGGGSTYTSNGTGTMTGAKGTTGTSTYNNTLSPTVKQNVRTVSQQSSLRSSKGLGSSMKSGGTSSSRAGG